jgi:hypothetical protein
MKDIEIIAKQISEDIDAKPVISESGLSRLYDYAMAFDCAVISASRGDPLDTTNCALGNTPGLDEVFGTVAAKEEYEHDQKIAEGRTPTRKYTINQINTRNLRAALVAYNYVVIAVRGAYIEGFNTLAAKRVHENSFFVVNRTEDPNFVRNIVDLGMKFCQDSVLISPKGGKSAYLYGTNKADWPGLHQTDRIGRLFAGAPEGEQEFHTRLGNSAFAYRKPKPEKGEVLESLEMSGKHACKLIADTITSVRAF